MTGCGAGHQNILSGCVNEWTQRNQCCGIISANFSMWEDMASLNRCKWSHICANKAVRCSIDRKICVFSENNIINKFLLRCKMYVRHTYGKFFDPKF